MSTSVESNTKKLTKKQLKTQKLRSGKGKAAEPEQLAVPESDLIGEDIVQKSKKRKRDSNDEGDVDDATVAVEAGQGVAKRKGDGAKSGKSSQQAKPKADKDRKQRFIVFVGNLPYKVTTDDILEHFTEACGEKPSVRLLTPKGATSEKSKGCAFVEFTTSQALQGALHLHQSFFKASATSSKRKINVELTAGGGGKSAQRTKKINDSKERLEKQREKHRTENEVEQMKKDEEKKKLAAERRAKQDALPPMKKKRQIKKPAWLTGSNATKLG